MIILFILIIVIVIKLGLLLLFLPSVSIITSDLKATLCKEAGKAVGASRWQNVAE